MGKQFEKDIQVILQTKKSLFCHITLT